MMTTIYLCDTCNAYVRHELLFTHMHRHHGADVTISHELHIEEADFNAGKFTSSTCQGVWVYNGSYLMVRIPRS